MKRETEGGGASFCRGVCLERQCTRRRRSEQWEVVGSRSSVLPDQPLTLGAMRSKSPSLISSHFLTVFWRAVFSSSLQSAAHSLRVSLAYSLSAHHSITKRKLHRKLGWACARGRARGGGRARVGVRARGGGGELWWRARWYMHVDPSQSAARSQTSVDVTLAIGGVRSAERVHLCKVHPPFSNAPTQDAASRLAILLGLTWRTWTRWSGS